MLKLRRALLRVISLTQVSLLMGEHQYAISDRSARFPRSCNITTALQMLLLQLFCYFVRLVVLWCFGGVPTPLKRPADGSSRVRNHRVKK